MNRLLLIAVVCALSGCRLHSNFKRTMITEPMNFAEYVSEKTERKRYRKIAAEVYETVWCKQHQAPKKNTLRRISPTPHAEGFIDGFVDYMVAGGTVQPPLLPPRKYWNQEHQSVAGHHAAHEWFAGYEHGATTARDGGYREVTTIPTLPQYYSYLTHEPNFADRSPFDPKRMHYRMMESPVYFGAMSTTEELRDSFVQNEISTPAPGDNELLVLSIPVPSAPPFVRSATMPRAGKANGNSPSEVQRDIAWTPWLVSTPDVLACNVYADDTAEGPNWSQPVVQAVTPTFEEQSSTDIAVVAVPEQLTPTVELTEQSEFGPSVVAAASDSESKQQQTSIEVHPVAARTYRSALRSKTGRAPGDNGNVPQPTGQGEATPTDPEPTSSPSKAEDALPVVKFVLVAPEPATQEAVTQLGRIASGLNAAGTTQTVQAASFAKALARLPEIERTSYEEIDE